MGHQAQSDNGGARELEVIRSEHYWLDTLLNAIPDLVIFKDGEGRWIFANDVTLHLFNLKEVDYRGQTDVELAAFSETHRDALYECGHTDAQAWKDQQLRIEEEHIPAPDGSEICIFETYKVPLFQEDGSRKGLLVIGRDITERRRSETQTRRLGRILEDSYNEIYVIDAQSLRYLQVNRGARLNVGYSSEELASMTPIDLIVEMSSREDFERRVASLVEGAQRMLTFEADHVRKDGTTYPGEFRVMFASSEIEPVFVAVVQDITERRRLEELKEEFLALVSHELRTPLTPILGVFDVLRARSEDFDDQTNQLIELAWRNSDRLRQKIEQLLTFRSVTGEEASLEWGHYEFNDVVRSALDRSSYLDRSYDYRLETTYFDRDLWVRIDRQYLEQCIGIVLANAVKFSPPGKPVQVEVRLKDHDRAQVLVRDQGPGIQEQQREAIFEPFGQVDSSATRRHGGTGLGLAIAHTMVEKLGGEISFESREAGGTTFSIELPLADAPDS